jgi:hypothetical protein
MFFAAPKLFGRTSGDLIPQEDGKRVTVVFRGLTLAKIPHLNAVIL